MADKRDVIARQFVCAMVFYMLAALVQRMLPFSVNRVLGAIIVLVLAFDYVTRLTPMRALSFFLICLLATVNVGALTSSISTEIEFYIYWITSLLILDFLATKEGLSSILNSVLRYRLLATVSVLFSTVLVSFLLITRFGYMESSWGGDIYFVGWCNAEHTMASTACLVMALALLMRRLRLIVSPLFFVVLVVMSWATLQTGARTFLVPVAIIWVLSIRIASKQIWCRRVTYLVVVIVAVTCFASTGMAAKFAYLESWTNGSNPLSVFTSGRDQYWSTDLAALFAGNPITWLFGASASFVYDLNARVFGMRIWAHNDIVMLLCSVGLIGCVLYLAALGNCFRWFWKRAGRRSLILLGVYVLFPAMINGFYSYQHFVYSTVLLAASMVTLDAEQNPTDAMQPEAPLHPGASGGNK